MTDMVWGPNITLNWYAPWFLFNLLVRGLASIIPLAFLEKMFIGAVFLLLLVAGRALVYTILQLSAFKDDVMSACLSFVFSLFFLFNPFVYDRALYGQFGVLLSYGFLLFALAKLLAVGPNLDFKYIWQSAIFSALAIMFSAHFVFLLLPFYILFFINLYSRRGEIKAKNGGQKLLVSLLLSVAIVLVLNANWLIALAIRHSSLAAFVGQGITNHDLIVFQTAGKTSWGALSNVLMMSGFWGKDQFRYADLTDVAGWQRSFLFLAPIIIYGIYLSFWKRSRPEKMFSAGLLFVFALAVVLALGIKTPATRGFSLFLYDHLPFYKGLREPQKWVAVIIPIYLYYLTIGAARLRQFKIIAANRMVAGFILGAVIVMQTPSLLWGFNRQVVPTLYPDDWYQVDKFLVNRSAQSDDCSDRILFLPWHLYMSFNWVGKIIANPAPVFFTCPVLSGTNMEWGGIYDNSQSPDGAAVAAWLAERGKNGPPVLNSPVRYIILAKELDFIGYLWLNQRSYVKPLLETNTLLVYEIKS
ncbi:MAG: hypothetical protein WC453_03430 [Patescibacteria group bacterium]